MVGSLAGVLPVMSWKESWLCRASSVRVLLELGFHTSFSCASSKAGATVKLVALPERKSGRKRSM